MKTVRIVLAYSACELCTQLAASQMGRVHLNGRIEEASCPLGCSSHGSCKDGFCECTTGWAGQDCSFFLSGTSDIGTDDALESYANTATCLDGCSTHGVCRDGTCHCHAGWEGLACSTQRKCSSQCAAPKGKCVAGACHCEAGYFGPSCEDRLCPHGCWGHGTCIQGACKCAPGWFGELCSSKLDAPQACDPSCSNNGECVNGECVCSHGYAGIDCSEPVLAFEGGFAQTQLVEPTPDHRHGAKPFYVSEPTFVHSQLEANAPSSETSVGMNRLQSGPETRQPPLPGKQSQLRGIQQGPQFIPAPPSTSRVAARSIAKVKSKPKAVLRAGFPSRKPRVVRADATSALVQAARAALKGLPADERTNSLTESNFAGGSAKQAAYGGRYLAVRQTVIGLSRTKTKENHDLDHEDYVFLSGDKRNRRDSLHNGTGRLEPSNTSHPRPIGTLAINRTSPCEADCSGHGACTQVGTGFSCQCNEEWLGVLCDFPRCKQDCNNRGECVAAQCVCSEGFYGDACQSKRCPDDCNGAGYCFAGQCHCIHGFTGLNCSVLHQPAQALTVKLRQEQPALGADATNHFLQAATLRVVPSQSCPDNCNGHGACSSVGECECYTGYSGSACESFCPNACSHNGDCIEGACLCFAGFMGVDCSASSCCSGHGTCDDPTVCECNSGWGGDLCALKLECADPDCSGHGSCVDGSCECVRGFTGPSCAEESGGCKSTCAPNGRCNPETKTCACADGFTGTACTTPVLTCPNHCNSKGLCMNGSCMCGEGWSGADCSQRYFEPGTKISDLATQGTSVDVDTLLDGGMYQEHEQQAARDALYERAQQAQAQAQWEAEKADAQEKVEQAQEDAEQAQQAAEAKEDVEQAQEKADHAQESAEQAIGDADSTKKVESGDVGKLTGVDAGADDAASGSEAALGAPSESEAEAGSPGGEGETSGANNEADGGRTTDTVGKESFDSSADFLNGLTHPADSGTRTLQVGDTSGLSVGDTIVITDGMGHNETITIAGFGSIIVTEPLIHNYPVGATILKTHGRSDASSEAILGAIAEDAAEDLHFDSSH